MVAEGSTAAGTLWESQRLSLVATMARYLRQRRMLRSESGLTGWVA